MIDRLQQIDGEVDVDSLDFTPGTSRPGKVKVRGKIPARVVQSVELRGR
jgi:hypothetical protein